MMSLLIPIYPPKSPLQGGTSKALPPLRGELEGGNLR
jgi:hypothetical protein